MISFLHNSSSASVTVVCACVWSTQCAILWYFIIMMRKNWQKLEHTLIWIPVRQVCQRVILTSVRENDLTVSGPIRDEGLMAVMYTGVYYGLLLYDFDSTSVSCAYNGGFTPWVRKQRRRKWAILSLNPSSSCLKISIFYEKAASNTTGLTRYGLWDQKHEQVAAIVNTHEQTIFSVTWGNRLTWGSRLEATVRLLVSCTKWQEPSRTVPKCEGSWLCFAI